ncbi:MAG: DUF4272 domain-containing protein [Planctomycetes bacterium]|nr:DUF4272 domain-containing protein [Planctomycetota bacterium]
MYSVFERGESVNAKTLRTKVFADLKAAGFRPATSLPMPEVDRSLRPPADIASRLMALDALFTWVAFPEKAAASERVRNYIKRNRLRKWPTEEEADIVAMDRAAAHDAHVDTIGWRLENMWPLAWALGFDPEPTIEASQIDETITRAIFNEFLPGLDGTVAQMVEKSEPRSAGDVIALEYRFYCAHNAVRSAQLGGNTVPEKFHPIIHGGAVHERRHSLTWCISPDNLWDDTDLST